MPSTVTSETPSVGTAADAVSGLVAGVNAATAEVVTALGAISADGGWCGPGHRSFGHWASIEFGIPSATANVMADTARLLEDLPGLAGVFASGEVGFDKIKVAAAAATPATDEAFVTMARHGSVEQLRRVCCAFRRAQESATDDTDRRAGRGLWFSRADRDGLVEILARVSPEDAAVVAAAIDAHVEAAWRDQRGGTDRDEDDSSFDRSDDSAGSGEGPPQGSWCHRRADALVALAETGLAAGPTPCAGDERHQVVVHIDADHLTLPTRDTGGDFDEGPGGSGRCAVELDGQFSILPIATAQRLACDAAITAVVADALGRPLGVGHTTKRPPRWVRRALKSRDGGCAYPGCRATRWVDAHHIIPWPAGPTDLTNLVLLCRRHHRLFHEGHYSIEVHNSGRMTFLRPDGRAVMRPPAPATPEDRARAAPRPGTHLQARSGGAAAWSLADTVQALIDADTARARAAPPDTS